MWRLLVAASDFIAVVCIAHSFNLNLFSFGVACMLVNACSKYGLYYSFVCSHRSFAIVVTGMCLDSTSTLACFEFFYFIFSPLRRSKQYEKAGYEKVSKYAEGVNEVGGQTCVLQFEVLATRALCFARITLA